MESTESMENAICFPCFWMNKSTYPVTDIQNFLVFFVNIVFIVHERHETHENQNFHTRILLTLVDDSVDDANLVFRVEPS